MYILMSSDVQPRYKEDVLRCVALPPGAELQFRYAKKHIPTRLLDDIKTKGAQEALVCAVASVGAGALTVVPVRLVSFKSFREHGTTVSLRFEIGDFATADPSTFTSDLDKLSNGNSPRIRPSDTKPVGSYFFEVAALPAGLARGTDLKLFELVVDRLREHLNYKDEPFFWTILGMQATKPLDTSRVNVLPEGLKAASTAEIYVYHYQPAAGMSPNSVLTLNVGPSISVLSQSSQRIDSRYDLKFWRIRTGTPEFNLPSWCEFQTGASWSLELHINVQSAWVKTFLRILVAAVAISGASVLGGEKTPSMVHLIGTFLFGVVAAVAVLFKMEKVV